VERQNLIQALTKASVHVAVTAPDRNGREGKAYRFSGKGDFIEFPGNPDFSTAGSISVSAWVRPHTPAAYSAWVSLVRSTWGSQWRLGSGPNPVTQWEPRHWQLAGPTIGQR
jgi:hypothetical protein